MECAPHARSKHSLEKRDTPPASSQTKTPPRSRQRTSSRGAEVSDSSPHLKSHLNPSQHKLQTSQQRTNVDSSDLQYDLCNNKSPMMLIDDFLNKTSGVEVQPTKPSCSYSMATTDFPSTSSSMNGPTPYILEYPLASSFTDSSKPWNQPAPKQRLFVCSFCGKAFNRPKKVEIDPSAYPHGREAFSLLDVRQNVLGGWQLEETPASSHRRETLQLSNLRRYLRLDRSETSKCTSRSTIPRAAPDNRLEHCVCF